jgi:hypothetical protein
MIPAARSLVFVGAFLWLASRAIAVDVDREPGFHLAQKICADCHGIGIGLLSPNPAVPSFFLIANRTSTTEVSLRAFLRTSHDSMPNIISRP